jgi:DNA-binding XRE family transcriptional regulator
MDRSTAAYPDFGRDEVAEAFALALKACFARQPELRDADTIGVHRRTLAKWERGEDLPGFETACNVLCYLRGWPFFIAALQGGEPDLSACVDSATGHLRQAMTRVAQHPPIRERRLADARLDDLHDALGALRRSLKTSPADEDAMAERRVPREVA